MRLIDADALIEQIKNSLSYKDYEWSMYADEFIETLDSAPTIEPKQADDLISRADALSKLCLNHRDVVYIDKRETAERIKAIPSAQPKPEYIDNSLIIRHYDNGMVAMNEECFKRLDAQPKQGEWIPISERLPENGHYYLWCSDMGSVQSDYYWDGFEKEQKYGYNIVAWMPLPQSYDGARMNSSEIPNNCERSE